MLSDGELMARVGEGSVASFAELHGRYCGRAFRIARAVCGDDGRAQEAVQDGFLSVWNSRTIFCSHKGTVAAWLLTVVHHRAVDSARSDQRHASRRTSDSELAERAAGEDPSVIVIRREEAERLQASVATLPDAQAEVVILAYFGQLTHTEIAAQLGLAQGTVKGRIRLGLQKLRADFGSVSA